MKSSYRHNKLLEDMCSSVKSTQDNNSLDVDEGISDRGSDSELDSKLKSVTLNNSHSDRSLGQCTSPTETGSEGRTSSPVGQSCSSSQETSTSAEFSINTNCSAESGADNYNVDDVIREPVEHCDSDSEQTAPPSPGDRGINDMDTHSSKEGSENLDTDNKNESENWDNDEVTIVHEEPFKHYFNMVNRDEDIVSKQRCKYNLCIVKKMYKLAYYSRGIC